MPTNYKVRAPLQSDYDKDINTLRQQVAALEQERREKRAGSGGSSSRVVRISGGVSANGDIVFTVPSDLLLVNGQASDSGQTFELTLTPQAANTALMGPLSGASDTPTFRQPEAQEIAFDPTGLTNTAATDVQDAIADLDGAIAGGGSGTVTSVDVDIEARLGQVSGVPITTTGTIALDYPAVATLTNAATITVDASLASTFKITLTGNRTLGNPSNAVDGQKLSFLIRQDGVGNRTLTLDTKYRFGTVVPSLTLSTAAGAVDWLGVIYDSTADKFDVVAFDPGHV